jgi:hypothetical protein
MSESRRGGRRAAYRTHRRDASPLRCLLSAVAVAMMGRPARIYTHGLYESVPPPINIERLAEVEKNLNVEFSDKCRLAILDACHRYCKNEIAFKSRVRRAEIEPKFQRLKQWFAKFLELLADSTSEPKINQAILQVMQRAFPACPNADSETDDVPHRPHDPRRLQQFFNDLLAVHNEIYFEIHSLSKGDGVESEPSAWDLWVQSLKEAIELDELFSMPRHDPEGENNPSFFVLLITELYKYLPDNLQMHKHSNLALAQAVQRAIDKAAS